MVHLHALHIVTRNIIGLDFSVIKKNTFFYKITTYFPDFFPLFYENNPFENPEYYNFPYQHVTPDFLFLVYQMPERLDLLDIAEKKKMVFGKFLDYVINYVMCYNNDHGKQIYTFMSIGKGSPFYIRYNK